MKPRRRLQPGQIGSLVAPDRALVPVGLHGLLTPVKAAASGGGYWIWTCACGTPVHRLARNVIKAVKAGGVPKCDGCNRKRVGVAEVRT